MREDLPTGTVTFLFSDIEGSTKLLNRLGDRFPSVLETHQRLMRRAFAAAGGREMGTEGDSFFVVFPGASQAVAAAVEAQRSLAAHDWGTDGPVKVRMGLHTGEAVLGGDNYTGVDVHRAARIAGAGHGGQVLVSAATRALVEHSVPDGVILRDLGEHRLKDLAHPERLYQVVAEGLQSEFPPVRAGGKHPTNLPPQRTSFVGRRKEVEEVKDLVRRERLVTLTGPGGTGKTRLSLQVGAELLEELEDGVFFVGLGPLSDPDLVLPTVAAALGLREAPATAPIDALTEHLQDRNLLLILDNFEQLLAAGPEVGQLLSGTESVRVLATSREPLGLQGEQEYAVPPLRLPDVRELPPLEVLSQYESVALFVERATAVKAGFRVTNENAPAVAEIAARLDGLPLAIELAAARVKLLTPQAILKRLEDRLSLLVGGGRDVPARQQTLRDAIAWSYDLLEENERRLFARLAVFRGGFTLEAAEAVCNPDSELGLDTLDGVASLANKSLLRQTETEHGEPRFFMLHTIWEYARGRLQDSEDLNVCEQRHGRYFLELAERAVPYLLGQDQTVWLDILAHEHDNFRVALDRAERADVETAFRLAAALWRYWQFRGHLREARERLERIVALPAPPQLREARARTLDAAGGVAYWMGAFRDSERHYSEALAFYREAGDRPRIAEQLYNLSFVYHVPPAPMRDLRRAEELLTESLETFRQLDDRAGLAKVSWGLSQVYFQQGRIDDAEPVATEALESYRQLGDRFGTAWSLYTLGLIHRRQRDATRARDEFRESITIFSEAGDVSGIALLLSAFAALAAGLGESERAARLAGAAFRTEDVSGTELVANAIEAEWIEPLEPLRTEAGDAWADGERMSVEESVTFALSEG